MPESAVERLERLLAAAARHTNPIEAGTFGREYDLLARHAIALANALRDLHAEVEMGESVGVCLNDRVPSLAARDALAAFERDLGGVDA